MGDQVGVAPGTTSRGDIFKAQGEEAQRRLLTRITNDFRSHFVHPESSSYQAMDAIRDLTKVVAEELVKLCPDGRELSTALTKLEEAMFWANAAVARRADARNEAPAP